ncbi:uncharacterized protein [Periplaneta americana]|uniref:uncharacterized protein isoform X2 n=1 Tax=Periplaneta americana TaxID=6978 RepID=UPI0037E70AB6
MDEEKKEADCEAFDEDKEEGEDGVGEEKEEEDDGVEENEEEDDGVCEEEEEEVHEVGEDREEDHEIFGNLTKNPFKSERMFQNTESLYRRPPKAANSLDRPPWNVVQRCWMASAMALEADLLGGGVSPRTYRRGLGEVAEAGMVYAFCRL